jgi:hypothetical protein
MDVEIVATESATIKERLLGFFELNEDREIMTQSLSFLLLSLSLSLPPDSKSLELTGNLNIFE